MSEMPTQTDKDKGTELATRDLAKEVEELLIELSVVAQKIADACVRLLALAPKDDD